MLVEVKVKVRDWIAVVISEIIGRSGRHFLVRFLWWHSSREISLGVRLERRTLECE